MKYNKQIDNDQKYAIHQMLMIEDMKMNNPSYKNSVGMKIKNGMTNRGKTLVTKFCLTCGCILKDVPAKRLRCKQHAYEYTLMKQNERRRNG